MAKIATVVSVTGKAYAYNPATKVARLLKAGDAVERDEIVQTAAGAQVQLEFSNGQQMAVAAEQAVRLDESVSPQPGTATPTAQDGSVSPEAIIQALERGGDLSAQLEATAAGLGGGGGGQGNSGFVRLLRISESVDPLSYQYETALLPDVDTLQSEPLPESPPPEIGVSVSIGIPGTTLPGGPIIVVEGTAPGAGVQGVQLLEGANPSGTPVTFQVLLSEPTSSDVTITYTIVEGTAIHGEAPPAPGVDFYDGALTGTVTIPAGYAGFTVTEYIVGDYVVEPDETFFIVLSDAIGATLVNDTATVTIVNDDFSPTALNDSVTVNEDDAISIIGNVLENDADPDGPNKLVVDGPVTLTNAYGTVTIQVDGAWLFSPNSQTLSQINALDAEETLQIVFPEAYQISDGFNFGNLADLTINIVGQDDSLTVQDDSETFTAAQVQSPVGGTVNVLSNDSDPDASDNPLAVQDTASQSVYRLNSDGSLSSTIAGSITFNANGTYSLALNDATRAAAIDLDDGESFRVGVQYTAVNQDAATDDAILRITVRGADDPMLVADDADSFTAAQVQSPVAGTVNVLSNDSDPDASDNPLAVQDTASQSVYRLNSDGSLSSTIAGSITFNANGTYSLALNDATRAAAIDLDDGESLRVGVRYTAVNQDAATDDAILRITVRGQNQGPKILVKTDSEEYNDTAAAQVHESGLVPNGTGTEPNGITVVGKFKLADPDGLDDIDSVKVAGDVFTIAAIDAASSTNPLLVATGVAGELHFTGFDNSTGEISFYYELTSAVADTENDNLGDLSEIFTVAVSDDGETYPSSATLTVTIVDDLPVITVSSLGSADPLPVDETNLSTSASASFADNFTNEGYKAGADTLDRIETTYSLGLAAPQSGGKVYSGLTDAVSGQAVILVVGTTGIEGRTETSDQLVFTLSVDNDSGSESFGTVTLDQDRAVRHDDPDDPKEAWNTNPDHNSAAMLTGSNLISLTREDTIYDQDGDYTSSSASIDLTGALAFEDDGPSIGSLALSVNASLVHDETPLVQSGTDDSAAALGSAFSSISATPIGSALVSTVSTDDPLSGSALYGADGTGSTAINGYKLTAANSANFDAVKTNLQATNGNAIFLYTDSTNQLLLGKVGNSDGSANQAGAVAFAMHVNTEGQVVLAQYLAIDHGNGDGAEDATTGDNESLTLSAFGSSTGLVFVTASVTVTDGDGDSITQDLTSASALTVSFLDDGPSIDFSNAVGATNADAYTGTWQIDPGTDQSGGLVIDVIENSIKVGGVPAALESFVWTPSTKSGEGSFSYFNGVYNVTAKFWLTLNDTGTYTITMEAPTKIDIEPEDFDSVVKATGPVSDYVISYVDGTTGATAVAHVQPAIVNGSVDIVALRDAEQAGVPPIPFTVNATTVGTLINASSDGIGVGNNSLESYVLRKGSTSSYETERLTYDPGDPDNPDDPSHDATQISLNFKASGAPGFGASGDDAIHVTVYGTDSSGNPIDTPWNLLLDSRYGEFEWDGSWKPITTSDTPYSGGQLDAYQIEVPTGWASIDRIEVTAGFIVDADGSVHASTVKVAFGYSYDTVSSLFEPVEMQLEATITDGDGDQSSTKFMMASQPGHEFQGVVSASSNQDDLVTGTNEADTLQGGAGEDVLHGGTGADVFKWSLADVPVSSIDHITDFDVTEDGPFASPAGTGDALDLRNLIDTTETGANLTGGYLSFAEVGGKLALVVDLDGQGTGTTKQTIVFDNFAVTGGNIDGAKSAFALEMGLTAYTSDSEIIDRMIADGHLKTDAP
jgi:VCBS repeat-containing protein